MVKKPFKNQKKEADKKTDGGRTAKNLVTKKKKNICGDSPQKKAPFCCFTANIFYVVIK